MIQFFKNNLLSLFLVALSMGFVCYLSDSLPEQIPTRWGADGNPTEYSNKGFFLLFFPILNLAVMIFIQALLKNSPKGYNMAQSFKSVSRINLALSLLLMVLYMGTIFIVLEPAKYTISFFFALSMGLFLLVAGNVMSKVERNFFIGVRVPWTLASERNWNATHRFAAKTMFVAGALLLALSFLPLALFYSIALVLCATLSPVLYSYWFFKYKELKEI